MANSLNRASVLECQRGDNGGVLGIGLSGSAGLRTVDENFGNATIFKSANAARVELATAFEPVQPVCPAILQALSEGCHDDAPAPAIRPKMPF
jgi:hypothetical protein